MADMHCAKRVPYPCAVVRSRCLCDLFTDQPVLDRVMRHRSACSARLVVLRRCVCVCVWGWLGPDMCYKAKSSHVATPSPDAPAREAYCRCTLTHATDLMSAPRSAAWSAE